MVQRAKRTDLAEQPVEDRRETEVRPDDDGGGDDEGERIERTHATDATESEVVATGDVHSWASEKKDDATVEGDDAADVSGESDRGRLAGDAVAAGSVSEGGDGGPRVAAVSRGVRGQMTSSRER